MKETIYLIRKTYIQRFYPQLTNQVEGMDYDQLKAFVNKVMEGETKK